MVYTIRKATPNDRDDLFRICLLTADAGTDGSALYSDPHYPGLVWAVPYLELEPDFAFVLTDGDDVLGYIVGTPDSEKFDEKLIENWWPELKRRYGDRKAEKPSDPAVLDRIATPPHSDREVTVNYPAHLHINLLPPAQSGGWGRRMIETMLAALKAAGVPAVHLGVSPTNDRAIGFYKHLGFAHVPTREGVVLGKQL